MNTTNKSRCCEDISCNHNANAYRTSHNRPQKTVNFGGRLASEFDSNHKLKKGARPVGVPIEMEYVPYEKGAEPRLGKYVLSSYSKLFASFANDSRYAAFNRKMTLRKILKNRYWYLAKRKYKKVNGNQRLTVEEMKEWQKEHGFITCDVMTGATQDYFVNKATGRAYTTGVKTCKNYWCCPVCAAVKMARNRDEVRHTVNEMTKAGFMAVMVTFTIPHYFNQSAAELIGALTDMLKELRSGNNKKQYKDICGLETFIRALEVMYGRNGWHFHTHEIWFIDPETDLDELNACLIRIWERLANKRGLIKPGKLKAFRERAVNISFATSDYLNKQDSDKYFENFSKEVTYGSIKSGKSGSLHPFELALAAYDGGKYGKDSEFLWSKFEEFRAAIKGKKQIYFPNGLKRRVGLIVDKEPEDTGDIDTLEPAPIEEREYLFSLNKEVKDFVTENNLETPVFILAEKLGARAVDDYIRAQSDGKYHTLDRSYSRAFVAGDAVCQKLALMESQESYNAVIRKARFNISRLQV